MRDDPTGRPAHPVVGDTAATGWSPETLLAAVRHGDERALAAYYTTYHPLLMRLARRWGIPEGDASATATDVLTDVAMALLEPATITPRSLPGYLTAALRNAIAMRWRADGRADVRAGAARGAERGADGPQASAATPREAWPPRMPQRGPDAADTSDGVHWGYSDYTRRVSAGAPGVAPADPVLTGLIETLTAGLPDRDRLILVWTSHGVPLRTIAAWSAVSYAAAAKRVSRLRARLRRAADVHLATLPAVDQERVRRVVRRALPLAVAGPVDGPVSTGAPVSPPFTTPDP